MTEKELEELMDEFCLNMCLYGSTQGRVCSEAYACTMREETKKWLAEEQPSDSET